MVTTSPRGSVTHAWTMPISNYQHVLIRCETPKDVTPRATSAIRRWPTTTVCRPPFSAEYAETRSASGFVPYTDADLELTVELECDRVVKAQLGGRSGVWKLRRSTDDDAWNRDGA
jgi:hypothetical protein